MKTLLQNLNLWFIETGTRACTCENCADKRRLSSEIEKEMDAMKPVYELLNRAKEIRADAENLAEAVALEIQAREILLEMAKGDL